VPIIDDCRHSLQATRNLSPFSMPDASPQQAAITSKQKSFLLALLTDLPD